ncbi:hypothetical protein C2G38_2184417 [Gigaspora rosea]|uniref:Uncharacterized protein n=1 Tax=Gigaspora rosea TaxID=44941 RepID=A0A397V8X3_9GLOM|nr:hypothetical protein C2G38_2184417 [Gigaspora rosea]
MTEKHIGPCSTIIPKKSHKNVRKGKARKTNPQDLYKTTSDARQFTKSNADTNDDKDTTTQNIKNNNTGKMHKPTYKTLEKNAKPFQKNAEENPTKTLEKTQDQSTRSSARPPHKTTSDARSVHKI